MAIFLPARRKFTAVESVKSLKWHYKAKKGDGKNITKFFVNPIRTFFCQITEQSSSQQTEEKTAVTMYQFIIEKYFCPKG